MASLSEDDHKVIKHCPLNDSLGRARELLQEVERSYALVSSVDGAEDGPEHDLQDVVLHLLATLMGTRAAYRMRSKVNSQSIASDLAGHFTRVQTGDFNYTYYRPLVNLIIRDAPDLDIWSAVFDLISEVSRVSPPPNIPPASEGTPIKHSSASQQGSEQSRRHVDPKVFDEIKDCIYRDAEGFFEKYFEGKDWGDRAQKAFDLVKNEYIDRRWSTLLNSPTQDDVVGWIFRLQDEFLPNEQRRYYTIKLPNELTGAESKRQTDLIVKRKTGEPEPSGVKHDWRDIDVIGELKASEVGVKRCYSPGPFDIHNKPKRFVQVIAGYIMMNEDELGRDTFTERDGDRRFINIKQDGSEMAKRLQLKPDPLTHQRAIVCRGTACYLTKAPDSEDWNHVTKFSWTSDRRKPEANLLRLANQKGVEGIARLVSHCSVTSMEDMRSGLVFKKPYSFRGTSGVASSFLQSFSQSQPPSILSQSFGELRGLSIAQSTGERTSLRKRKSADVDIKPSKRSRRSNPLQNEVTYDVEDAQGASLLTPADGSYDNRILRCLVIYPAGRPIYKYESLPELLEALRDAIKAHRSLYSKGNILHRDISENNIIITDSKKTGHAGMLIDMDLAKELGSGRSGSRYRTGTMEFMAIEVLFNIDHTYRHDLESFFYIFIWQCGRRGWEFTGNLKRQPTHSQLTQWYTGSYTDIAIAKHGMVDTNVFELVLANEFPPEFECLKPLCRELRGILFPIRDNAIFVGTPKDPEILYGPIIKAFDRAIEAMGG
ncbi:hypothetical protein CPC735_031270 [Coccidioides posadasii C735 delta SOWgp]|uniref:EKC/KEOPS complex subunit BUD32 n=1 Tax=Coccidioides posadasii (strain C735) TaxID=222929 RepID=C5P501_COCP7|nr:hypothetical protein CPC735_031270 [Coccidioides posadasii C735 delta SOWgp]EER27791.1 hypothetical protein CPC735_031270 [Coccidioides posadasii C735 delta SOWgp]|eukprot:XP_003069936.1 hypothetical protein CPC735_031270 [Coccidioides posadasii C735 delta SOWgp]